MSNINTVPKYACILDEGSGEYIVYMAQSKDDAIKHGKFFTSDDCEEAALRFYVAKLEIIAAPAPTVQKE